MRSCVFFSQISSRNTRRSSSMRVLLVHLPGAGQVASGHHEGKPPGKECIIFGYEPTLDELPRHHVQRRPAGTPQDPDRLRDRRTIPCGGKAQRLLPGDMQPTVLVHDDPGMRRQKTEVLRFRRARRHAGHRHRFEKALNPGLNFGRMAVRRPLERFRRQPHRARSRRNQPRPPVPRGPHSIPPKPPDSDTP